MITIKQVQSEGNWVNKDGVTYWTSEVHLSDDTSGRVNAKTENKWKAGDEVEVTNRRKDKNGNDMFSLKRAGLSDYTKSDGEKPSQAHWDKKDERIGRQWAINTAIEVLQLITTSQGQITGDEIARMARQLIDMRDNLSVFKTSEDNQKEDLPF